MRLLVDTHTWLWMLSAPDRLPARVREIVANPSTEVLVSAATAWEIAIKHGLGKLPLPEPPSTFVPSRLASSGCVALAIDHGHALTAGALPSHHRDPFDRLLIAQSQVLQIPLCSGDRAVAAYEVDLLWG